MAEEANNREALYTAAAADESRDCGGYEVSENNASTIQIQGHQSVSTLLLVLVLAPRGFSPGAPVFPSPQKPTHPNSNSILEVSPISILC